MRYVWQETIFYNLLLKWLYGKLDVYVTNFDGLDIKWQTRKIDFRFRFSLKIELRSFKKLNEFYVSEFSKHAEIHVDDSV